MRKHVVMLFFQRQMPGRLDPFKPFVRADDDGQRASRFIDPRLPARADQAMLRKRFGIGIVESMGASGRQDRDRPFCAKSVNRFKLATISFASGTYKAPVSSRKSR